MTPEQVYAILIKKIKTGGIPEEQIQTAIDIFLENHPEYIGATPEQAQQIAENAAAIEEIKENIQKVYNYVNTYSEPISNVQLQAIIDQAVGE